MREPKATESAAEQFPRFIRGLAPSARGKVSPPETIERWESRLASVRAGLIHSFGRQPESPCPLEPEVLGTLAQPGVVIERLTFQSRPGVRVTANLYRPDPLNGRLPAVLSVHGHWAWARIDPVVQTRCIGLARLGYVCLCVDAFGAGERAIEPGPGTYHGGLVGASLWPVGTPLIGLQVYDNRRAVDYLISRPEVDAARLAVTGASGGGNQTLYAGATDDRFAAVVPVCGIGTYESYLTTACCVCEVNPGGLTYATTGDLLAMIAPRALLVVSATRDAVQFSVGEAARSIAYARERYRLLGQTDKLHHLAIESGHDYNRPMREALYGWLERWLKGKGNGAPVSEPDVQPADPQALRCYPDGPSRPKTVVTIPEFVYREGLARLAALPRVPDHRQRWESEAIRLRDLLRDSVLGGFPPRTRSDSEILAVKASEALPLEMSPEEGLRLRAAVSSAVTPRERKGTLIIVGAASVEAEILKKQLQPWRDAGYCTAVAEIRATGRLKPRTDPVAGVADHHESEWAVWLNRPLLGQWVWDVVSWIDVLERLGRKDAALRGYAVPAPFSLAAWGPLGVVALLAAGFDQRIQQVFLDRCLVSFVPPSPMKWAGLPMGLAAPGILEIADIAHLAALLAPRRLVFGSGIEVNGQLVSSERMIGSLGFTRSIYELLGTTGALSIGGKPGIPPIPGAPPG
jgi:dienelactone hydrolase